MTAVTKTFAIESRPLIATDRALLALLALAVLILRLPYIGYPEIHVDEQYYLIVGDRILNGDIPYVDIWDRKPVGLFLLYAIIRMLGGDGYTQYQIVAALFVVITCWFLLLIARRYVGKVAAFLAAISYAAWLSSLGGAGGQSPVFYNSLTVIAAWMVLRAMKCPISSESRLWACKSMAVFGIVLQIKYTAVPEGMFFGLALLWDQYRRNMSLRYILWQATVMVIIALAPTLLALSFYAGIGEFHRFFYANFLSVFDRAPQPGFAIARNLKTLSFIALPLLMSLPVALLSRKRTADREITRSFLIGWLVAGTIGFVMIGNYFDHYALPLLIPVFLLLAPLFDRKLTGPAIFLSLLAWALFVAHVRIMPKSENSQMVDAMTDRISQYTHRGATLYIDDAPMILYLTTRAKSHWRILFPFHLTDATERYAIGVDTHAEMRKLVAARPGVIVTASAAFTPLVDHINRQTLDRLISRDYVSQGQFGRPDRRYTVNVRRDLVHDTSSNAQPF